MKKILGWIGAVIGYYALFASVAAVATGFVDNNIGLMMAGFIFIMPIGFIIRWLSLLGKTKKQRLMKVIDDIFILLILYGIISLFAHLSLPSQYISYISNNLIVAIIYILSGSLGLFFIGRSSLKVKGSNR